MPTSRYEKNEWRTTRIEDHIALISRQIRRSMHDPDVRNLAVQIVSGRYDWVRDPRTGESVPVLTFKGRHYRAPVGPLCRPKDDACEIGAVWDTLVMNIRYVLDPEDSEDPVDLYQDVTTSFAIGGADCDDYVTLFAALLKSLGYQVGARVISLDGRRWAHIYPVVLIPKTSPSRQLPLDATESGKRPGWEFGRAAASRTFSV